MADPFTAALPSIGQAPWNLNPSVQELRDRVSIVDDTIGTGRLSATALTNETAAQIQDTSSPVSIAVQNLIGNYESETLALFARMDIRPDTTHRTAINNLIKSLKTAGIWSKLKCFYIMAAHTQQAALLNWVSTARPLLALNSPNFVADRGFTGDGGTSLVRTDQFSMTGLDITPTNASMGIWARTNVGSSTAKSLVLSSSVTGGSGERDINPNNGSGAISWRFGGAARSSGAHPDGTHFVAVSGNGTDAYEYRHGALDGSYARVPTDSFAATQYLIIGRNGSFWSTRQHSAAFLATYLTDGEQANLYNSLADYMISVGAL